MATKTAARKAAPAGKSAKSAAKSPAKGGAGSAASKAADKQKAAIAAAVAAAKAASQAARNAQKAADKASAAAAKLQGLKPAARKVAAAASAAAPAHPPFWAVATVTDDRTLDGELQVQGVGSSEKKSLKSFVGPKGRKIRLTFVIAEDCGTPQSVAKREAQLAAIEKFLDDHQLLDRFVACCQSDGSTACPSE